MLQPIPPERREATAGLLGRLGDTLWWWLIGRLISMFFVGLVTWRGPTLFGIPLALVLAVLAALLSFGVLAGLIGVACAAPLIAVAMVLVRELHVDAQQGDRSRQNGACARGFH